MRIAKLCHSAAVQVGRLDLVDDDPVGLAQRVEPLARDLADDPDRQARARERLAQDHRLGQAHLQADLADLVLEQVAQRLDELEAQVGRQAADVVVGLDLLGGLRLGGGALDDVGVERALGQEVDGADLGRLLLEDADELVADDLALLLGVLDAGEPGQEALARIDHDQVHAEVALEGDAQQLRFLLAHQPVVDVDAGQPIADRAMDEGRRDGASRRRRTARR